MASDACGTAGNGTDAASSRTSPARPLPGPRSRPRHLAPARLPRVPVGPFRVADASADQVIDHLATPGRGQVIAFALHVGGLNVRHDQRYVRAMNAADLVYADGTSVVQVAKAAGAERITRAATTDIGLPVIAELAARTGRTARVALIGGPPGLAEQAAVTVAATVDADVVLATHGFHQEWPGVLAQLRECAPDVVIVGLGMPLEAIWVQAHRDQLPQALVLTCGGWLGFLAGDEQRAPRAAQRFGFEWAFRLTQQPRLIGRYARGTAVFARLYLSTRARRATRRLPAAAPRAGADLERP